MFGLEVTSLEHTVPAFGQWMVEFFSFDPVRLTELDMIVRLALQAFLLVGSAFFSGSETALFSLSRLDLQQLRRKRHPRAPTLHGLLNQPRRLIISILCGNELVNIAAVANMTGILVALYGAERGAIINVVVMVPLLLLVGEITPKTIAVSNPVKVSTSIVAVPLSLWVKIVAPLRWVLRGIADRVTVWIVGDEKTPDNILQLDEFRSIVDEIADEGKLKPTERTLIFHLLDAGATEVVQIMTPRTHVEFLDADLDATELVAQFRRIRHSRVPVYRGHRDNVIGLVHIEKILPLVMDQTDLDDWKTEDFVSPAIVVPPTKKIDEMLDFFQMHNARAAVVLNEFGGVEGLVTMRDVLTFVFGALSGEVQGQELYEEQDQDVYEVAGDMRLVDFNNLTNFGIDDPRMTTIGGVFFRHFGRLPAVGDELRVEGVRMKVLEMKRHRILRLRVERGVAAGAGGPQHNEPEP